MDGGVVRLLLLSASPPRELKRLRLRVGADAAQGVALVSSGRGEPMKL